MESTIELKDFKYSTWLVNFFVIVFWFLDVKPRLKDGDRVRSLAEVEGRVSFDWQHPIFIVVKAYNMGNSIKEYCDARGALNWKTFEEYDFWVEASGRQFLVNRKIFKDVCDSKGKGQIFHSVLKKVVEKWGNDYFVANLLLVVKEFFKFLDETRGDLSFLFFDHCMAITEKTDESRDFSCVFGYLGENHIIEFKVALMDQRLMQDDSVLIGKIVDSFEDLSKRLSEKKKKIVLKTDGEKQVSFKDVRDHYSIFDKEILVDPFNAQPTVNLMRINIGLSKIDFNTVFHNFIKFILKSLASGNIGCFTVRTHAIIEFLFSVLTCKLRKAGNNDKTNRKWRKKPKFFQYFKEIDDINGKAISIALLDYVTEFSNPVSKFTYLSSFFASSFDLRIEEIEEKGPRLGLKLLLLLNSFAIFEDVYFIKDTNLKWEKYRKFFGGIADDIGKLSLFATLIIRNPQLLNEFVISTEALSILIQLIKHLHSNTKHSFSLDLILVIFLKLSENKTFVSQVLQAKSPGAIDWLAYSDLASINLGSLLLITLLHISKENLISAKYDHIQTYISGILFNIVPGIVAVHEVFSLEFFSLIKGLYRNYIANIEKNSELAEFFKDTCQLYMEYLAKIFQKGLELNPSLVRVCINQSDFFKSMLNEGFSNLVLKEIVRCLEIFEKSIEGKEDVEFQIQLTSKLQRFGPVRSEFLNFNEVKYLDQSDKWQDFILNTILETI